MIRLIIPEARSSGIFYGKKIKKYEKSIAIIMMLVL